MCSSHFAVYTIGSSKYALQLLKSAKTVFMSRWKVAGALHMPKAITVYSRKRSGVTNAEILEARSVKGTCQYPSSKSSLLTL